MKATPQQVSGGSLYSYRTRLGNWQEEIAIGEAKLENFRTRSETGNLALRKQEIKFQRCNEVVPHSFLEEGILQFGSSIILQHDVSHVILACDPFEDMIQGQEKFLVTGSHQTPTAKARNVFTVVRPPKHLRDIGDDGTDNYVRVGQAFMLQCSDSLLISQTSRMLSPSLYVCSTKKNERTATRSTNRQMVYMSSRVDADAIWFVSRPSLGKANASERFLANGTPVNTADNYMITHRQTNQYLAVDPKNTMESEFGIEVECFCDRTALCGKLSLMVSEFKGASTAQTLTKPDSPNYAWRFLSSSNSEDAIDVRGQLPPAATRDQIMQELLLDVKSRGVDGFWNLRAFFLALDKKAMNVGKIDRQDLMSALHQWGCSVEDRYLDTIVNLVDVAGTGLVSWKDFIRLVRDSAGSLSDVRQGVLMDAFARIDVNGAGNVTLDDIAFCFRGADHPLCTVGQLSEKDALAHMFISLSTKGRMPSSISFAQFADYFSDLSACVEDDDYFAALLNAIWAR